MSDERIYRATPSEVAARRPDPATGDRIIGGVFVGDRFGRLVVLGEAHSDDGERAAECICDCGAVRVVRAKDLRRGATKSCGCIKRLPTHGNHLKHGQSSNATRTPTYRTWAAMLNRCTNENATDYAYYGGRGIAVDPRWRSFENFLADMGERPAGRTLDRRDNDGPYTKDNCRWATRSEQSKNRRPRGRATAVSNGTTADAVQAHGAREGEPHRRTA